MFIYNTVIVKKIVNTYSPKARRLPGNSTNVNVTRVIMFQYSIINLSEKKLSMGILFFDDLYFCFCT